jgi:TPR repeat protein
MKHLLVVLVAIVSVGCAHREAAKHEVPPKRKYALSETQREVAEREAYAGDNAAARRIADYYYFTRNDRATSIWWLKLAAKRGDAVAQEDLKKLQQE